MKKFYEPQISKLTSDLEAKDDEISGLQETVRRFEAQQRTSPCDVCEAASQAAHACVQRALEAKSPSVHSLQWDDDAASSGIETMDDNVETISAIDAPNTTQAAASKCVRFDGGSSDLLLQNRELLQTLHVFQRRCSEVEAENCCLRQSEGELEEKLKLLTNQCAEIMGHRNHKQKIHYTVKLQEENTHLRSEHKKARVQVAQLAAARRSEDVVNLAMPKEHSNGGARRRASTDGFKRRLS